MQYGFWACRGCGRRCGLDRNPHLELSDESHCHGEVPGVSGRLDHGEVEDLTLGPAAAQPLEVIAQRNQERNHLQSTVTGGLSTTDPHLLIALLPIGQQCIAAGNTHLRVCRERGQR